MNDERPAPIDKPVLSEDSTTRSFFLDGPTGRIEALLNEGSPTATHAAIICHPHPLFGGTMHNKVAFHTMKALNHFGIPVLRFHFRGTGLSAGDYSGGEGEVEDARAALDWLEREFPLPVILAGFSFGAAVGLRTAYNDDRVCALIALGLPVAPVEDHNIYHFEFLQSSTKPKLLVSGARDQYAPVAKLKALVDTLTEPKKLVLVEGADHFFGGRLKEMRIAIDDWVQDFLVKVRSTGGT